MTEDWVCDGWTAIHDFMPGRAPTLRVTGSCTFPRSGYQVSLRPHEPQGINPFDYLFDLVVVAPEIGGDVVTEVPVAYVEETSYRYTTVTIIGSASGVPVEDVS
jgi:hypothetical protein